MDSKKIVAALAARHHCGSCRSDPPIITRDPHGAWHLVLGHEASCPVLTGAVCAMPDTLRAIDEAAS